MSEDLGGAPAADAVDTSTDIVETPNENTDAPVVETPTVLKYKAKDPETGEELELTPEELVKDWQLRKHAHVATKQAAQMRKQAEDLINLAKTDPRKLLQHPSINADLKALAEAILAEQIEEQLLTPAQKKAREQEARLAQYEHAEAERARVAEEAEFNQLTQSYQAEMVEKFGLALESSTIPKTENTLARMAQYQMQFNAKKIDVTPQQLAGLVAEDLEIEHQALRQGSTEEQLLARLGPELIQKLIKAHLKTVQKPNPAPIVKKVDRVHDDEPKKKYLSRDELRAKIDSR